MRDVFYAVNPGTGQQMEPGFYSAAEDEIDAAARLADQAFAAYSRAPGRARAALLRSIAQKIEAIRDALVE
ncbi:MAG: aldehyde dehydrogenase family protein, partial [Bryobacteraceae bacterium]